MKDSEIREQDRWLPLANVYKISRNALPKNAKVSKDAKECFQECVSEFVSFITSEASDRCLAERRKTINGEDVLRSMHALGFENYAEVLKIYLTKYREAQALVERNKGKKPGPNSVNGTALIDDSGSANSTEAGEEIPVEGAIPSTTEQVNVDDDGDSSIGSHIPNQDDPQDDQRPHMNLDFGYDITS